MEGLDVDVVVTTYYDLTEGAPDIQGSDSWWLARFNDVVRQVAGDSRWEVVDLEPVFQGRIAELTWYPADVHPNNTGHRAIAAEVWGHLGYDDEAPSVTIERPEPGEVPSRTPTIRVLASDNLDVHSVDLVIDGEVIDELIFVPTEDAYLGVWDARDYPGGGAQIEIRVRDLAGNEASEKVDVSLPAR
jgi:hypothetical protein